MTKDSEGRAPTVDDLAWRALCAQRRLEDILGPFWSTTVLPCGSWRCAGPIGSGLLGQRDVFAAGPHRVFARTFALVMAHKLDEGGVLARRAWECKRDFDVARSRLRRMGSRRLDHPCYPNGAREVDDSNRKKVRKFWSAAEGKAKTLWQPSNNARAPRARRTSVSHRTRS
jgi:hypothetical protein